MRIAENELDLVNKNHWKKYQEESCRRKYFNEEIPKIIRVNKYLNVVSLFKLVIKNVSHIIQK